MKFFVCMKPNRPWDTKKDKSGSRYNDIISISASKVLVELLKLSSKKKYRTPPSCRKNGFVEECRVAEKREVCSINHPSSGPQHWVSKQERYQRSRTRCRLVLRGFWQRSLRRGILAWPWDKCQHCLNSRGRRLGLCLLSDLLAAVCGEFSCAGAHDVV